MNNLVVYKSNSLIEAAYKVTTIEQRILLYCISKINPINAKFGDHIQEIYIDDFLTKFPDMNSKNAYIQLKKGINKLGERWVKVKDLKDGDQITFRWIQAYKYSEGRGLATIMFSDLIRPYLINLKEQFTKYPLNNVSGLKHIYSIRLYELLCQFRTCRFRAIGVSELRTFLNLENKYPRFDSFKQRVITPALTELNSKSDLMIEYSEIKKGRNIELLHFSFKVKDRELKQVKQSKSKHKQKTFNDSLDIKVGMILIGSVTNNEYTIKDNLIIFGADYDRPMKDGLSIGVNDLVHIRDLIDAKKLIVKS